MLTHYFKIAYRNYERHKFFVLLSVLSLAIALTSAILIGMYVKQEFSYDKFHARSGDIYRLVTVSENQGLRREVGFAPLALAPFLKEYSPVVESFARIWVYRRAMPVSVPERNMDFYEDRFAWAEDTFFDIFDFEIVAGDRERPLREVRSVVLTESTARKYFGDEDPLGRQILFRGETDIPLFVTAVMGDFPVNSHFRFDFIANIRTAAEDFWQGGNATQEIFTAWNNLFVPAYILVTPGADLDPLLAEATARVNEHLDVPGSEYTVMAQRITDIHLMSRLDIGEFDLNGSIGNLRAVVIVGVIVLALGCFNFVNLVTALAGRRAREVGLRKTLGGNRAQLVGQHYFECSLLVIAAAICSLVSVELILPLFNNFIYSVSMLSLFSEPAALLLFIALIASVVLLSGAYPALFVSRFNPVAALKGNYSERLGGGKLRRVLVTLQFAMSGALIICTIVVYQQLDFMRKKDLGFSSEQVVVIPIHRDNAIIPRFDRLKDAFLKHASVRGVTASSHILLDSYTYTDTFRFPGSDQTHRWQVYTVDGDFPVVYDLELIAGRVFRSSDRADTNAVILNEEAVRQSGLQPEELLGRIIEDRTLNTSGPVVGIVRDFHFHSLYRNIQPFTLLNRPDLVDYISVKISPSQVPATMEYLKELWSEIIPEASFGYFFLDSTFETLYAREEKLGRSILAFSLIAIFLACLGLFGLSLYTAERRTKEIGVRKVLGASVWDIVRLLGSEFTRLVVLALFLALPVSYFLMNRWLDAFAYRIEVTPFILTGGAAAVLTAAWLTVLWHSLRAAGANPVHSLRSE